MPRTKSLSGTIAPLDTTTVPSRNANYGKANTSVSSPTRMFSADTRLPNAR